MYLARVIGRLVATHKYPGLESVPLQWIHAGTLIVLFALFLTRAPQVTWSRA